MNLPDALLARVKEHARKSDRTVTSVVEQALMELLERASASAADAAAEPFDLPTYGNPEDVVQVDLSDNEAVRDLMDDSA